MLMLAMSVSQSGNLHPDGVLEWTMRVLRLRSALPLAFCFLMLMGNARVVLSQSTTTTVTISNTVETGGIDRPGINLGGLASYGSQQLLKSLNYVSGGYFPGTYAGATYPCSSGGSNTTTTWYNNITDPSGFPANFWAGASFVAINAATGTSYGSGVVTTSTSNTGTTGITFTLSPALSAACNPSQNDVLVVRQTTATNLFAPNQLLNVCSGASWDTSDTSPSSSNTQRSLQMPTGCGLTFYIDGTVTNRTNTNASLATQQVNFINLNGSYDATFKAKCLVAGCSINFSLGRLGGTTYLGSTTVNPGFSSTPGTGWTTYDYPFTASDTGTQDQTVAYSFACTGSCLLQDADVVEGSTLPGNTTTFRDAVVYELQKLHPGSIRYMDASQWCSDVADEIAPTGNRRWCGASSWTPSLGQAMGYNDVLELANLLNTDVLISVGQLNQPSDWAMLVNWLSSSGWLSKYAASGHAIYLEDGNEAWNSGVGSTLFYGNGFAYGYTLGQNMAAAKSAAGYDPHVIKLVANAWAAPNQGYGPFGWVHNVLTVAQATPNGLPDFVDDAPYTLNYLGNFDTYGSSVATTGAPFLDEWAEDANIDSVTTPLSNSQSMYLNQQYAKANFGVGTLVYEVNQSTLSGVAATQLQLDQIGASVGNALAIAEHILLMQRDSQLTGPIHAFTLAEPYTGYTCNGNGCSNGVVMPLWGANLFMATGPGQTPGSANSDRPLAIGLGVVNNAIGSNSNLMSVTQSGTPAFNYPGGQAGSIQPNAAVPYVNCFAYSNGQGSWTTICFNNNLTTAESVTLTGPGAPTGPVSETIFPQQGNVITDHNDDTFLGEGSSAPVVAAPTAISASGTTYSVPPASFIALTYTAGGTSTLAPPTFSPGSGTYAGTQTVMISFPPGSTGCVGINTTPLASTAGTCGAGGTTYTGPITVTSSETVNAIATQAGSSNSAVATAVYNINLPAAAAPTFSPVSGTYTGAQTVTISTATPGATIYYTTDGTTPTTSSSVYNGPITVSSSETLEAIAAETGYTQSAVATGKYTINSGSAIVSFYPGTLSYLSQSSPYPSLLEPQAVVVTGSGSDLFIADEGGQEVGDTYTFNGAVWDYPQPSGTPTKIGGSTFVAPSALALDASGNLYIADYNLGAVYTAPSANRSSVTQLTISGGVALYHPIALAFDPSGNLYIGDTGPDGFSVTATNPGFIVKVPVGGGPATKLSYTVSGAPVIFPQALTTDTAGNLYIADGGDGQTSLGDLVVVPANTGLPSYIPTGSYTLSGPAGLGFDPALNLYVLDGYNARVLTIPVTLAATTETPSFGTAALLPQTIPMVTGSSMLIWPSGQEITITDIGDTASSPVTQVVTLETQIANIAFGPIPLGSSQNGTVTAMNVGNVTANFTSQYTETGDTVGFTANLPVCSGGIASQQQCKISFTYQPDQVGSTTAQFSFYVNSAATPSNYVNASGTSTNATVTVTLEDLQTMLTYDQGTNADALVSGKFATPTGTGKSTMGPRYWHQRPCKETVRATTTSPKAPCPQARTP
jgi:hypothetical protein